MDGWVGLDLRVGGGIEHLTVLIRSKCLWKKLVRKVTTAVVGTAPRIVLAVFLHSRFLLFASVPRLLAVFPSLDCRHGAAFPSSHLHVCHICQTSKGDQKLKPKPEPSFMLKVSSLSITTIWADLCRIN